MKNFLGDFLSEILALLSKWFGTPQKVRAKYPCKNPCKNSCKKNRAIKKHAKIRTHKKSAKICTKNPRKNLCKKSVQKNRAKIRADIRAKLRDGERCSVLLRPQCLLRCEPFFERRNAFKTKESRTLKNYQYQY